MISKHNFYQIFLAAIMLFKKICPMKTLSLLPVSVCVTVLQLQFSSVAQSVRLFETPWITARQASLSITNSRSLPKLMSIESVMPSNYLILCCPLLLPPSIFPCIRVFSNESALDIRRPQDWSFSFNIGLGLR